MRSSADRHVGDLDFREVLPVPRLATIPATPCKSEDPDLLVLAVAHNFSGHLGTFNFRRAGLNVLAVARDEDVVERHLIPRLGIEQRDFDRDSRLGAKLSTAAHKYGVAHRRGTLIGMVTLVKFWHVPRTVFHATAYCSVTSRPAGRAIILNS